MDTVCIPFGAIVVAGVELASGTAPQTDGRRVLVSVHLPSSLRVSIVQGFNTNTEACSFSGLCPVKRVVKNDACCGFTGLF